MAKALTAIAVEKAKSDPTKRMEIPDGGCRGLYLVVQPGGSKSWAVRYRAGGKPAKLTLGAVRLLTSGETEPTSELEPEIGDAHTLAQARRRAADVMLRVARNVDPAAERRTAKSAAAGPAPERQLFEVAAEQFLSRYAVKETRESTWRETARLLGFSPDPDNPGRFIERKAAKGAFAGVLPRWRGRRLREIARTDVRDLLDDLEDAGTRAQAKQCFAAVRQLFNWCVERELLSASPCAGVKAPTGAGSRERVLGDDELYEVWEAAGVLAWPFGDMTKLLILTGARRDEVAEMRWTEVDLGKELWTLPRERAKNDMTHEVPLSRQAVELLKGLPRIGGRPEYVFTTGSGRARAEKDKAPPLVPISGFSRAKLQLDKAIAVRRAEKAKEEGGEVAEIQPWRLHDLRRTVASGMARLGIGLPVIEKVLNHRSGSFAGIVGVYQRHGYAAEKRTALQAWADHVERLPERLPTNVVTLKRG